MSEKRALLLVGSPKVQGSTSEALGSYLLGRLGALGFATASLHVGRLLRTPDGAQSLRREVACSTLVVISTPLYVDSLPAPLTAALEILAPGMAGADGAGRERPGLLAIVNSGFPEAHQNDTALAICRLFARQAGFRWLGGLPLGGGEVVGGRPLEKAGGVARLLRQALNLAAESIAAGAEVPAEAVRLMARPLVPRWLYILIGEMGWRRLARRNGVRRMLRARPYEEADISE